MKILIVSEVIAGKGHEKAAYSIAKAIETLGNAPYEVQVVNLLSIVSKAIEKTIHMMYLTMIKRFPALWGFMYKKETRFAFLKKVIAQIIVIRIKEFIEKEQPDIIIATHASGLGALSKLKSSYSFKLAAVFTDYHINSFWIHKNIDYYFIPHEEFKEKLMIRYGVDERKIYATGIPIDPIFSYDTKDIPVNQGEMQQESNSFKILIMGGGLGLGGIHDIILTLDTLEDIPVEITVVTGTNKKLYKRLTKRKNEFQHPIHLLEYVEDIYTLMRQSQVLISKSGGITISEALSIPIPLLIYKPIPGQEEFNLQFLIKNKSAIRVRNNREITHWVKYIYQNPKMYSNLLKQEKAIAKPNSSIEISKIICEAISNDG